MSGNPVMCVTGVNRGIGLELARQYLADGWDVVGTVRSMDISREDSLEELTNCSSKDSIRISFEVI